MEFDSPQSMTSDFWRPLCIVWEQRIAASKRARQRFDTVSEQCTAFAGSSAGFMWDEHHKKKFFNGNLPEPKFKITINKAHEFVAIYGPSLFWQYPHRKVDSQRTLEITPEIFGDPNDPQVQQVFQQFAMQDNVEGLKRDFANHMMENYLAWSQREQPNGLMTNAISGITEALLTGRGVMWPETYQFPGSENSYTKLQYDTVRNLFIDADCNDQHLESAGYIMRRHVNPIWQVEQIFDLPKGSLRGKGQYQSAEQSVREQAQKETNSSGGAQATFDKIEWFEIWSKVGVGPRMNGSEHAWLDTFDEVVGDFAYLCIAPGVPFPLNSPPDRFFGEQAMDPEQTQRAFEWRTANYGHPFPVWKDNRWPVALLDFIPVSGSPWPMSPLAPGLGELIALNILTSSYVDQAWENRKTIIGYLESAGENVKEALESDAAFTKVAINDNMQKSIGDVIQFLKRSPANTDILQAISMMDSGFDRAVGLNELMRGESARQVRVASDIRERSARSSVRPDKMAMDVAKWMSDASQLEMFLAAMHVDGESLTHLLGGLGGQMWDQEFKSQPVEVLLREMKATVEASEVRKPDKERDTANVQSLQQYLLPTLTQFAQQTGNTDPHNRFLDAIGKAMEMETEEFHLPPWKPPVDEQQQQMQQQMQQLEMAKTAAEVEDKKAGATQKQATAQKSMVDAAATMADSVVNNGDVREMEHEQRIRQREEEHDQGMIHNQETHVQKLLFEETEALLNEATSVQTKGPPV
ncbi:MAG: hypothetical protein GY759_11565 [Chloroflexi bacterium]|nr:hypothetical protein [Chloroflexota bacterium]